MFDLIGYYTLITLSWFIKKMPRQAALFLGRCLGRLAYLTGIRRNVARKNLKIAFPGKTQDQIDRIIQEMCVNLGLNLIEYIRFDEITADNMQHFMEVDGFDYFEELQKKGQGVILVGGHFGNWEMMGLPMALNGYPLTYVVARLHNILIDCFYTRIRNKKGVGLIERGKSTLKILNLLKQGGNIGILMDQDAGKKGLFVPFFGKPASTHTGPAILSVKAQAPIIFLVSRRNEKGIHKMRFDPPVYPNMDATVEDEVQRITKLLNRKIEKAAAEHPEYYFWFHNKWRTPVEKAVKRIYK